MENKMDAFEGCTGTPVNHFCITYISAREDGTLHAALEISALFGSAKELWAEISGLGGFHLPGTSTFIPAHNVLSISHPKASI